MSPNGLGICEVSLCEIWALKEPHIHLLADPKGKLARASEEFRTPQN